MHSFLKCWLVGLAILAASALSAHAQDEAPPDPAAPEGQVPAKFDLFLRSFTHNQGIDAHLGLVPADQLGSSGLGLPEEQQSLLRDGPSILDVVVYIPRSLPASEQSEYAELVKAYISRQMPHASVQVFPSFLDGDELRQEEAQDNAEIDRATMSSPARQREMGRFLKFMNRAQKELLSTLRIQEVRQAIRRLRSNSPAVKGMAVATLAGISKGTVNATLWWGTSKEFGTGLLAGATSYMLDVWFARNSENWVRWKRQSRLTWFSNSRLVKWINGRESRRVYLVDFLNGFFWNLYFRTLAHLDHPTGPASPAFSQAAVYDLWAPFLLDAAVGGPLSAASQVAINQLRQKGHLSRKIQFYSFLAYDTNFTASSFLLQKGFALTSVALKVAEWATRLGYIGANAILSPKEQKLVLIDSRLSQMDRDAILYNEGIEHPREFEEAHADWQLRVNEPNDQTSILARLKHWIRWESLRAHCESLLRGPRQ